VGDAGVVPCDGVAGVNAAGAVSDVDASVGVANAPDVPDVVRARKVDDVVRQAHERRDDHEDEPDKEADEVEGSHRIWNGEQGSTSST
jgi:hypothetical protein